MPIETPVMLLFFNRPNNLKRVFETVKLAQPKKLFLVQDGARIDRGDEVKIKQCRDIVSDISWDCEVFCNYSETNLTCDHREYTGISWCFEHVDRLIILEDDCVPTQSFYRLCDYLLDKYKDTDNVHSISGFNRLGIYNSRYDYVFSKTGAGWGWATWKRDWERTEKIRSCMLNGNDDFINEFQSVVDSSITKIYGDVVKQWYLVKEQYQKTGIIPSWEFFQGMTLVLYDMLTISPTKNMIKYIGVSQDATHGSNEIKYVPHIIRKYIEQEAHDISFPLKEPDFPFRDTLFEKENCKLRNYPQFLYDIEAGILRLRYGDFDGIRRGISKRLKSKSIVR